MKELGENFKDARSNMGISLDEVSNDLGIDKLLLDSLEDGNTKTFKDVLTLKETIIIYAKYLGLDQETIIDEYNDYMFSSTSKISTEDIKEATKKIKEKEKELKKIKSPYTIEIKENQGKGILIISFILLILILVILYFVIKAKIIG